MCRFSKVWNSLHSDNVGADESLLQRRRIHRHVADLVGVSDRFLQHRSMQHGLLSFCLSLTRSGIGSTDELRIAKRFWYSMILWDLIHEVPYKTVSERYTSRVIMFVNAVQIRC